jgi:predicted nucleotidyltransferase
VRLGVLFGSVARGEEDAASDLDLLVALRRDGSGPRAAARERLEAAAGGRRVQLVGLGEARALPLLLADILRDGRVLVDRDGEWPKLKRRERAIQQQAREADRRLDEEAWAALERLDSE